MNRPVRMALLAVLATGLAALAGAAEGQPPVLDRELFFGNPEIAGAQLSPDGQYIAFLKPWKDTRNIYVKKTAEPFDKARLVTTETKRPIPALFWTRDSKLILYVKDNDGDENFNVWAVDPAAPNAAGSEAPASRNLTDAKGARAFVYALPKKLPDTIFVGLNDRDAAWHDVYKVSISTGQRELLRKNTERIAGWDFDLEGRLRLAGRVTDSGDTEILKVEPEGFKKVYSCTVFETCGTQRFHKDGKRVYMQTNKGEADLTRLVLFDPETGQEEPVESDPLKRVDLGDALFAEATRRARRHDLRGRAHARLLPGQGLGSRLQAAAGQVPRQGHRPGLEHQRRPARADHGDERRRPGRALPLRSQHEEADAAVQGARADPARAHGERQGRTLPLVGRPRDPGVPHAAEGRSRRRTCRRSCCRTAAPGRATAGASTTSASSWRTAATRCSSRTSAARPATARSS